MMKNIEVDYNKYKKNMDSAKVRLDTHAGSWYSDNRNKPHNNDSSNPRQVDEHLLE